MAATSYAILILVFGFSLVLTPSNSERNDATAQLWKQKLFSVDVPASFSHRFSPLSPAAVSHFTTYLIDDTLSEHSAEFCRAAGIVCYDKYKTIFQPLTNIGWTGVKKWTRSSEDAATLLPHQAIKDLQTKHVYFREKSLVEGGQLFVNNLLNLVPGRSFLPKEIASRLPFSTDTLSALTKLLGLPSDCYLSKAMALSLQECEMERVGEKKTCATSLEDMMGFAVSALAPSIADRIHVLSTDAASSEFPQTATFQQVSVKVPPEKPLLACHDLMFPFALYYCHQIPNTKAYQASWTTKDGRLVRAAAVCHMKTEGFDPFHPAFAALNMKPGDGEVCHWIADGNLLMWVAA